MGESTVLSRKEEKRALELGRQVFLNDFPNPDRKGCPESKLIKQIAAGRVAAAEENKWIDHLTSCSPCSREFSEFRCQFRRQKRVQLAGGAAVILIAIFAAVWLAVGRHAKVNSGVNIATNSSGRVFQQEVLDLRSWSAVRSDEGAPNPGGKRLELYRGKVLLSIYLPMGSQPGKYDVEIVSGESHGTLGVSGVARIENGNTVLRVRMDLSKLIPGQYSLGIRQPPWDWRYYPFALR